jgi:hypothetical protein
MKKNKIRFSLIYKIILIFCFALSLQAQVLKKAVNDREEPKAILEYPAGSGWVHMVAGDLWNSFIGSNMTVKFNEATYAATYGGRYFLVFGGSTQTWTAPCLTYPHSYPFTPIWSQFMGSAVYEPDTTMCPDSINKKPNYSFFVSSIDRTGAKFSRYLFPQFRSTLQGATDPARTYVKEAYYADGKTRNHMVAEEGWVTNLGIDVKVRAHQFAAPNWNNFNDFIILEISLKNTGNVDMNMDGTFERTNHKIAGIVFNYNVVPAHSIGLDLNGTRVQNTGATTVQRLGGYIADPDPDGYPWDFQFMNAGQSEIPATKQDMGFNCAGGFLKDYIDQYHGHTFLAVRKGGLPADITKGTAKNERKTTIWGNDAIGVGAQRGWYKTSGGFRNMYYGGYSTSWPKDLWTSSLGAYYTNGGFDNENENFVWDETPNPNFFDRSKNVNERDYLNWVPKTTNPTEAEKPNGDKKYYSDRVGMNAFLNLTDETGMADKNTPYPTGFGKHTKGYKTTFNFDGAMYSAVGPISLDVNEEVTVVFCFAAGYRLEGLQKAIRAARYAYDNDYVIPTPPPMPDIKVSNTLSQTINIEWDNAAETDPNFAGYKIWKSANFLRYKYLEAGMRLIDRYQEQMIPGESKESLKKPINPKFDAFNDVTNSGTKGQYVGYYWGTWELSKVIPKSELANYKNSAGSTYAYKYEDKGVLLGFTYWYYVSAYGEGTYKGPNNETTGRIETHYGNRNGASNLWTGTFPYAWKRTAYYPKDTDLVGLKNIGASVVVSSPTKTYEQLNNHQYEVGVRPNPYKRAALHDNYTSVYEHQLFFYNLPMECKITILDVAGRLIDVIKFSTNDPTKGSTFWKMFSKDGVEVASGYYVYIVEWKGGKKTGIFSILR